jgi:hypothetical protein
VAVVNYPMMTFEWYRDTIATHHPELSLPPPSNSRQLQQLCLTLSAEPGDHVAQGDGCLVFMSRCGKILAYSARVKLIKKGTAYV